MRRPDARQPRALADDEFIGEIEIGIAGRAGKTETRPRRESRCSRRCPRSRNKRIRVSEALSCPFLVEKAPCAMLKALALCAGQRERNGTPPTSDAIR